MNEPDLFAELMRLTRFSAGRYSHWSSLPVLWAKLRSGAFHVARLIEDDEGFVAVALHLESAVSYDAAALLAVAVFQGHHHVGGEVAETVVAAVVLPGDGEALFLGRLGEQERGLENENEQGDDQTLFHDSSLG
jgi:hypothetical protein